MNTTQLPKLTAALIRAAIAAATSLDRLAFQLNICEQFAADAGLEMGDVVDLANLPKFGGPAVPGGMFGQAFSWGDDDVLVYRRFDDVGEWSVRPRNIPIAVQDDGLDDDGYPIGAVGYRTAERGHYL